MINHGLNTGVACCICLFCKWCNHVVFSRLIQWSYYPISKNFTRSWQYLVMESISLCSKYLNSTQNLKELKFGKIKPKRKSKAAWKNIINVSWHWTLCLSQKMKEGKYWEGWYWCICTNLRKHNFLTLIKGFWIHSFLFLQGVAVALPVYFATHR